MKTRTILLTLGLGVVASGLVFRQLQQEHRALRQEREAVAARASERERQRVENERLQRLLRRVQTNQAEAQRALQAELERARQEVEQLERQARNRFATHQAEGRAQLAALETNRDLRKGLVLVENCANVGNATPVDALQTTVWAGTAGRDDILAQRVAISGAARAVADATLATLPESTRTKYPDAESLVALYIQDLLSDVTAVQVLEEKPGDPRHVTLRVAQLSGHPGDIPMQLGADGWQVDLSQAKLFERIKAQLLKPRR